MVTINYSHEWHEDYSMRQSIGIKAEADFQMNWVCHCGGVFDSYYTEKQKGSPDFKCETCGQYVEVKSCTKKPKDTVSFSQIPYERCADETIIAYKKYDDTWIGAYRKYTIIESGPHPSVHTGAHATPYYWIKLSNFIPLSQILQKRTI